MWSGRMIPCVSLNKPWFSGWEFRDIPSYVYEDEVQSLDIQKFSRHKWMLCVYVRVCVQIGNESMRCCFHSQWHDHTSSSDLYTRYHTAGAMKSKCWEVENYENQYTSITMTKLVDYNIISAETQSDKWIGIWSLKSPKVYPVHSAHYHHYIYSSL